MPPKAKISRENIIQTALEIVREQGDAALNAREIAARLHCSTQPIFSNFSNMTDLRFAVIEAAHRLYRNCLQREVESGKYPPYKASGMGYIRFAGEEKELFKLLFMRDRTEEAIEEETEEGKELFSLVEKGTGLSGESAKVFHLEMWACVHGIAVMIATNYLSLDWDLISRMISDVYLGMKHDTEQRSER